MKSLSFALVLASGAALAAPASQVVIPDIPFEKHVLPNGLQVILHVDRTLPVVNVNLWYHVGSKNERPGRTGFAHLYEHLMFEGSAHSPGSYWTTVQNLGARGGAYLNGTTNDDRTNYFETVPAGTLEHILWLESDRLATLGPTLTQQRLDSERGVVRNERREGENRPYGRAEMLIDTLLFPAGHPYSWPVIGSHEDLLAATVEDVKDFFSTYYRPNNLSLAIVGDIDPKEAMRLVEKYFGGLPPGPPIARPAKWLARLDGPKVVEMRDRVPQDRVYLVWPAPERYATDAPELALAGQVLADGLSSRLRKTLIYDRKLCVDVNAFTDPDEIAGRFWIVATLAPGASGATVEGIIAAEVARLGKGGPTAAELDRARTGFFTRFIGALEQIGGFGGKADILNEANTYLGEPDRWRAQLDRYRQVTPAGVARAVRTWLDTPNHVTMRVHPETAAAPAGPDLDRALKPAIAEDKPFAPPEVKTAKLASGLELFVVERHDLPVVAVELALFAGPAFDPPGKQGLAQLTAVAARRGTRKHGALELEEAFQALGGALQGGSSHEVTALFFEMLKPKLPAGLGLLSEVVREPAFAAPEVEREQKVQLERIRDLESDPAQLVGRLREQLAWGLDHPYARPAAGFTRTVKGLSRDDLVAFHQARWRPGAAALVFVGDVTLDEARGLAERSFAGWSGDAPLPPVPPPAPPYPGKVALVDAPGASQTQVTQLVGAPAGRGDDYGAWKLANQVWGGGVSGRLFRNIREDKGYSYGVFSSSPPSRGSALWYGYGGVQTDKTTEALREFMVELRGMAGARPIGKEELEGSRTSLVRGFALGFETRLAIAAAVAGLWSRRWPMSFMREEIDLVRAATPAAVDAAARAYMDPARSTLLLVGDRARIEAGVRGLKIGELVILDAEGRPATSR